MGAQISKTAGKEEAAVEKPAEGAAVAAKSNGQVNLIRMIQILIAQAEFSLKSCNVLRQWRAPCSPSASTRSPAFRESGHMYPFSPASALLHILNVLKRNFVPYADY